ncbi:AAA family ATPase [Kitasatospora sp. NPDC059327]|uniref:AAA family ATPase n=1 Tax=Kitasatospora sp. NPDC059327 TaxID=3346803 RepID=UPI0036889CD1
MERDDHLRTFDHLLRDAVAGTGRALLIEGPMKTGRTALLGAMARRAGEAGFEVLGATCSRVEAELPFGMLDQLLHRAPFPPGPAAELARLLAGSGRPADDATGMERARAFGRLSLAVLELAAERPLLLTVDDVRCADPASLDWLLHLVRRTGLAPVVVAVTDGSGPGGRQFPFWADLLSHSHAVRMQLDPLSATGVQELLLDRLAATRAPEGTRRRVLATVAPDRDHRGPEPLDEPAVRRLGPEITAASGGNPLLAHALFEDHRAAGEVRATGYGRALLTCLHRAEPILLTTVRSLAVLGEGSSAEDCAALTGACADQVGRAIDTLTAAGLLNRAEFRHPAAREAVLGDLTEAAQLSELHRRAAELRYEQGAPPARVAGHLLAAQDRSARPWAADLLVDAAEQSLVGGELEFAAACLTLALECRTGERAQAAVRARLAQVEWQLSPSTAAAHLTPLVAAACRGLLDVQHCAVLIRQLLWHGRRDEAGQVLERLRARAGEHRPDEAAQLRDLESWLGYAHPALVRHRLQPGQPPRRAIPLPGLHTAPQLQAAAGLAEALARGQSHQVVGQAGRVLLSPYVDPTDVWVDESVTLAVLTLLTAGRTVGPEQGLDLAGALTDRTAGPTRAARAAQLRSTVALVGGDFPTALREAATALERLPEKAWGVSIGYPLAAMILAETRTGDFTGAGLHVAQAVPAALFESHAGLPYLFARGHYRLATGHCHAAIADFLSCGELTGGWGYDVSGLFPWRTGAAEAWLRLGNPDQARKLIHDQLARPGADDSRTRGPALRLLASIGPAARRITLLNEALELVEAGEDRYELARVLADFSQAQYARGDRRRARLLFRQALYVADVCGARPLTRELMSLPPDVTGLTPTSVGAGGLEALTESERRVAALAVMGYTNREIAGRLFVTASTVEQHLTRVYRKLNIRHRGDLPTDLWGQSSKAG